MGKSRGGLHTVDGNGSSLHRRHSPEPESDGLSWNPAGKRQVMIVNTNPAIALAWQLLQAGKPASADEALKPLLTGGITNELAPLVGAIRLQQGRFSEAAPLLEQARRLYP